MKQVKQLDSLPKYNSGMVSIYRVKDEYTTFGAKINVDSTDDLNLIYKLCFAELSRRDQDFEFAEKLGFSLSLKIKTRYVKGIETKHKAVIKGYLYDIQYIDKTGKELFLYLEGVKQLDS